MLTKYEWVLFDADETLFHFDSFGGLRLMFSAYGVNFTQNHYLEYQNTNKPLWIEYQNGTIQAQDLKHKRFHFWAEKLNVSPAKLNCEFLVAMAEVCRPIDGALSLLNTLKGKVKLGIITNGFVDLQETRLKRHGLREYFDILIISEQVGSAKPHSKIFEQAITEMGNPTRDKILMVGDNPDSDILGGINAGLDTCWLNVEKKISPALIIPNFQVSSLFELEQLFLQQVGVN